MVVTSSSSDICNPVSWLTHHCKEILNNDHNNDHKSVLTSIHTWIEGNEFFSKVHFLCSSVFLPYQICEWRTKRFDLIWQINNFINWLTLWINKDSDSFLTSWKGHFWIGLKVMFHELSIGKKTSKVYFLCPYSAQVLR